MTAKNSFSISYLFMKTHAIEQEQNYQYSEEKAEKCGEEESFIGGWTRLIGHG